MKFIHEFLMLALIARGYFIREVMEPIKEAKADCHSYIQDGVFVPLDEMKPCKPELKDDPDFTAAVRSVVKKCFVEGNYIVC